MGYYVVHQHYCIELPDKPYNLWESGELWELVNAEEGAKVEIIGGDICIEGAPRPPLPGSPRARRRTVREAIAEADALERQFLAELEAEKRQAMAEDGEISGAGSEGL